MTPMLTFSGAFCGHQACHALSVVVHGYGQQLTCAKVVRAGLLCRLSIDQDQMTKP